MEDETIIGELKHRGVSMAVSIANRHLFWDKVLEKWVVRLGYGHTIHSVLYEGDSLDEAFDAICSAPTRRPADVAHTQQSGVNADDDHSVESPRG